MRARQRRNATEHVGDFALSERVGHLPVGEKLAKRRGTVKDLIEVRPRTDVPAPDRLIEGRSILEHFIKTGGSGHIPAAKGLVEVCAAT